MGGGRLSWRQAAGAETVGVVMGHAPGRVPQDRHAEADPGASHAGKACSPEATSPLTQATRCALVSPADTVMAAVIETSMAMAMPDE